MSFRLLQRVIVGQSNEVNGSKVDTGRHVCDWEKMKQRGTRVLRVCFLALLFGIMLIPTGAYLSSVDLPTTNGSASNVRQCFSYLCMCRFNSRIKTGSDILAC